MSDDIDYSRYYLHFHDRSPEHARKQAETYAPYLRRLSLPKDTKVLDIGCGMGFFVRAALAYGFTSVRGIDSSLQQIDAGKSNGLPVEHVQNTLNWLKQHAGTYDAIFMFDVLEHIPKDEAIEVVRTIYACLNPGGTLFVRVPNANSLHAGRYRWGDWTHATSFTEHSVDFVLYNGGFRDIDVGEDYFGRLPQWIPRPSISGLLRAGLYAFMRLGYIGEFGAAGKTIPLTLNIVATARKSKQTAPAHPGDLFAIEV